MIPFLARLVGVSAALTLPACDLASATQSDSRVEGTAQSEASIAFPGPVFDAAELLSQPQEDELLVRLVELQERTKHEMVIVTVANLKGEDIGSFTDNLGNAWGVGRAGIGDGIVLLVAPNEREARISVADGLSDKLPDAFCQEILVTKKLPEFQAGRFFEGIAAGQDAIAARLIEQSSAPAGKN